MIEQAPKNPLQTPYMQILTVTCISHIALSNSNSHLHPTLTLSPCGILPDNFYGRCMVLQIGLHWINVVLLTLYSFTGMLLQL